jgi:glycerophosphoryl diester phosphodiesterase
MAATSRPSPNGTRRPELVAHRGAPRLRTENTLAAFALAIDQGADAIELDVHATADGVVVVHHDPDVPARARRGAKRHAIAGMRWGELRDVELQQEERVPALCDVLALAAGRARVYVEIKGASIERAVVDVIRESSADCAVHSFDHAAIAAVRALAPDLPRGLLLDKADPRTHDIRALVAEYGARDLWPHTSLVDERLVNDTHGAGARIVAWTVNGASSARKLAALGVDALCTDDVPLIGAAIGNVDAG